LSCESLVMLSDENF